MDLFPEGSNDTLVYQSCALLDILTLLNLNFFFFNKKAKAFEDPLSAKKSERRGIIEILKII